MIVPGSRLDSLISLCGSTMVPFMKTSSCKDSSSWWEKPPPPLRLSRAAAESGPHSDVYILAHDALVLDAAPPADGAAPSDDAISHACIVSDLLTRAALRADSSSRPDTQLGCVMRSAPARGGGGQSW